ncbi:MAG: hypothetical protein AAGC56_02325 [Pseudomonadota bacterium]
MPTSDFAALAAHVVPLSVARAVTLETDGFITLEDFFGRGLIDFPHVDSASGVDAPTLCSALTIAIADVGGRPADGGAVADHVVAALDVIAMLGPVSALSFRDRLRVALAPILEEMFAAYAEDSTALAMRAADLAVDQYLADRG